MSFLSKTKIGLAIGGAGIGLVAGGYAGKYSGEYETDERVKGAAIGAVGGAAVGYTALGATNATLGGMAKVGGAGINAAGNIVDSAIKSIPAVGRVGAGMINGVGSTGALATIASPFRRHLGAIGGFSESLVRFDLPTDVFNRHSIKGANGSKIIKGVTLTGPMSGAKLGWQSGKGLGKITGGMRGALVNGKSVIWGASLASGLSSGFKEMNRLKMGSYDGQITRATPRMPSYENNGGADGDLVFALNNLRNGG